MAIPATPPPPAKEKPRPSSSFRLNKVFEEKPVAREVPAEAPVVVANKPFDLAAVIVALERFSANDQEKALHAALTAYPPRLEGQTIAFKLDNELLLAKAREMHPVLLAHFKRELENDGVSLQYDIYDEQRDEGPAVKRLYTAREKLDYFFSISPAARELCERLGLEAP